MSEESEQTETWLRSDIFFSGTEEGLWSTVQFIYRSKRLDGCSTEGILKRAASFLGWFKEISLSPHSVHFAFVSLHSSCENSKQHGSLLEILQYKPHTNEPNHIKKLVVPSFQKVYEYCLLVFCLVLYKLLQSVCLFPFLWGCMRPFTKTS